MTTSPAVSIPAALVSASRKAIAGKLQTPQQLIKALRDAGYSHLRPLNDSEGTVVSDADALMALGELIVNSQDALNTRAVLIDPALQSHDPFACAAAAFPAFTWADATKGEIREMARNIEITLAASAEQATSPQVIVRDRALGVCKGDFVAKLLTLHKANKRNQSYTFGSYQHGSTASLRHCSATVIASRPCEQLVAAGAADEITLTVLLPDPESNESMEFGYFVDADGNPCSIPASSWPDFEPGLARVMYDYDLGDAAHKIETDGNSIVPKLRALIYGMPYPVLITDLRTGKRPLKIKKGSTGYRPTFPIFEVADRRSLAIIGHKHKPLSTKDVIAHGTVFGGLGGDGPSFEVDWTAFNTSQSKGHHFPNSACIGVIVNGKLACWILRKDLQERAPELSIAFGQFGGFVRFESLTRSQQAKYFTSDRDGFAKGSAGAALRKAVIDQAMSDQSVIDGLYKAMSRARTNVDSTIEDLPKFNRELNKRLNAGLNPGFDRLQALADKATPRTKARPELLDEPTSLEVIGGSVALRAGRVSQIRLACNVADGWVPGQGSWTGNLPAGLEFVHEIADLPVVGGKVAFPVKISDDKIWNASATTEGQATIRLDFRREDDSLMQLSVDVDLHLAAPVKPRDASAKRRGASGASNLVALAIEAWPEDELDVPIRRSQLTGAEIFALNGDKRYEKDDRRYDAVEIYTMWKPMFDVRAELQLSGGRESDFLSRYMTGAARGAIDFLGQIMNTEDDETGELATAASSDVICRTVLTAIAETALAASAPQGKAKR